MPRYPLIACAVWLVSAGCAHAAGERQEARAGEEQKPEPQAPQGSLLQKFDPTLRWMLESKSGEPIRAIATLASPLGDAEVARLQAQGLTFLSRSARALHVSGDPHALLSLAAYKQVVRLSASKPLQPSAQEEKK